MRKSAVLTLSLIFIGAFFAVVSQAQSFQFAYQGSLKDGANPANGNYDFQFLVFDSGGTQINPTVVINNVAVTNGLFSVTLDFGDVFPGASRFLEIHVAPAGSGTFTTLNPRQAIKSTPYSVRSLNSSLAANAIQLGGVAAGQYVLTGDSRLSDARNPLPNSTNYIQNQNAAPQASSNFNISGNGTAGGTLSGNVVNTATQYNLAGSPILSAAGTSNLFAGIGAVALNNSGNSNSFFGSMAGHDNTTGGANAFFGAGAGNVNSTGQSNAFFGSVAGRASNGTNNAFFGAGAGNISGSAGNSSGSGNTLIGEEANVLAGDLTNAGAIGRRAAVGQSNSLVLGSINGVNLATADTDVGIGLTAPNSRLDVVDSAAQIRFGDTTSDDGGYLVSTQPSQAIMSGGAKWNGSAWVAKSTAASLVDNNGGGINFFTNGGLTAGSTFSPTSRMSISSTGVVSIGTLATGAGTSLCRNASNQISDCSASSLRYKKNIAPLGSGLNVVNRLRPITFDWKDGGMHDLGFGAEDVAKVDPLLVHYNAKGEVEGVKYDRIGVVLVNAVKEQQAKIEEQQKQIEQQQKQIEQQRNQIERQNAINSRQQKEIDNLKTLVCARNRRAAACRKQK